MNIVTDKSYRVYRHENQYGVSYSFGIAKKDNKGGFINAFIPVRFKNGVDVKDRTNINIKQAFLTFYLNKDNKPVWYLMILDYEEVVETIEKVKETKIQEQQRVLNEVVNDPFEEYANENPINDDDLPF